MEREKLDYKKKYKDLYSPKNKATLIDVPTMNFIMVDGFQLNKDVPQNSRIMGHNII